MSSPDKYHPGTTDILDERVDSSSILLKRLDSWREAVSIVQTYADSVVHAQQNFSQHLAKQHKVVAQLSSFSGGSTTATGPAAPTSPGGAAGAAGAAAGVPAAAGAPAGAAGASAGGSAINSAFRALIKQTQAQLHDSEQVAASVKNSVLPPLEILSSDLDKHHKQIASQASHLGKEVEKHREVTSKHLEGLGRVANVGSLGQKPEPKNDPYVISRKVRHAAAEQIHHENRHSESNLSQQNNFESLEQHIIEVLQHAVTSLNELTQRSAQISSQASTQTQQSFAIIQPPQEWALFKSANSKYLVPESGYQRDPSRVTFANSTADSTVPIIEGTLDRKGTVLKGNKPGYYVLTPAGFLHQFKSKSYADDTHPELSLYIPESEISGLPAAASGDHSFRIVSRDSNKVMSPHHKYTFTAPSYDELVAWHNALARVAGATASSSTLDNATEDPGHDYAASPTGVPGSPTTASSAEQPYGAAAAVPGSPGQAGAGYASQAGATPGYAGQAGATPGYAGQAGAASGYAGQAGTTPGYAGQAGTSPGYAGAGATGVPSAGQAYGAGGVPGTPTANAAAQTPGYASGGQGAGLQGAGFGAAGSQPLQSPQSDLSSGVNQLNLGGQPQQLQSDVNQFASAPQQFQSQLGSDANQLSSAPQQFQSQLGSDANQLSSAPQQFQSGLRDDVNKFTSGPQQLRSDIGQDASNLKNAPQQFQSGLKDDVNQFKPPF